MESRRPYYHFIGFLWLLALFVSLPILQPYELARLFCILAVFLASFLMIGKALREGFPLSGTMLLDAAFLFWLLLFASIFWSVAPNISFIAFCTFSLLPLGFYSFALSKDSETVAPFMFGGASFIIAALASWAVIQYFFFPEMLVNGSVREPFANPNSYAALISLGAFIALGHLFSAGSRGLVIFYTICCALMTAGLFIIGSRAVLLFFFPALCLFLFLVRPQIKARAASLVIIAVLPLLAVLGATLFAEQGQVAPLDKLAALTDEGYNSIDSRLDIWRASLAMVGALPWYGTGVGTFFLFYPEYRLDAEIASSGLMTHNDPLQFLIEAGFIAPVLLYLFAVLAVLRMISVMRSMPPDEPKKALAVALFCGPGAMLLHSHVSFNLYIVCLLLLSGLMLGYWFRLTLPAKEEEFIWAPQRWPGLIRWGVVAVPFVIAGIFLQGFLLSEYHANRARDLAMDVAVKDFAQAVNKANKSGFEMNARPYVYAATIPLSILKAGPLTYFLDGKFVSGDERRAQIAKAEEMLDKAEKLNPRLVSIYFYRARAREFAGDRGQAIAQLEKALNIDPLHQPSRVLLAEIHMKSGSREKALAVLKDGLHWPPRFHDPARYYSLTSGLAHELGDKEASERAQKLLETFDRQHDRKTSALPDPEPGAVFPVE